MRPLETLDLCCSWPAQMARDPEAALSYSPETGEFALETRDGQPRHALRFCPWCGGRLPESLLHPGSGGVSAHERAIIHEAMTEARTVDELLALVGAPTRVVSSSRGHRLIFEGFLGSDITITVRAQTDGTFDYALRRG